MLVYYCLIGGVSALGALLCWNRRKHWKDTVFVAAAFAAMIVLSSIRYHVGIDYSFIYSPFYETVLADRESVWNSRFEPGFKVLVWLIAGISDNYHILFVVTSIITLSLVAVYYWLHSPNPFISVFLFLTLSQFYCSMNFLRQTLAAAIALFALPLARKRTIPGVAGYLALVLLAASFHKSALILIPAYFLFQLPFNKFVLGGYAAVTVLVYFNTERIIALVTRFWYSSYNLESPHMTAGFEFPFTAAMIGAFLILLLASRMLKERSPTGTVYLHCGYFALFFMLMGSRHSILDRLSLYFDLCIPVAVAVAVHYFGTRLKKKREAGKSWQPKAVFAGVLVLVYGGGLAIHQFALTRDHHGVTPYQTIFQQDFYPEYTAALSGETLVPRNDVPMEPEDPGLSELNELPAPEPIIPQPPQTDPSQPETPVAGAPVQVPIDQFIS